jgi:hypothetical protein
MSFPASRYRANPSPSGRSPGAVYAIGRHVFVACPVASKSGVALTDDAGANTHGRLRDGTEVEIVAWRPRGPQGTRYLVRSPLNGIEGWLGAGELRGARVKAAAMAAARSGKGDR